MLKDLDNLLQCLQIVDLLILLLLISDVFEALHDGLLLLDLPRLLTLTEHLLHDLVVRYHQLHMLLVLLFFFAFLLLEPFDVLIHGIYLLFKFFGLIVRDNDISADNFPDDGDSRSVRSELELLDSLNVVSENL